MDKTARNPHPAHGPAHILGWGRWVQLKGQEKGPAVLKCPVRQRPATHLSAPAEPSPLPSGAAAALVYRRNLGPAPSVHTACALSVKPWPLSSGKSILCKIKAPWQKSIMQATQGFPAGQGLPAPHLLILRPPTLCSCPTGVREGRPLHWYSLTGSTHGVVEMAEEARPPSRLPVPSWPASTSSPQRHWSKPNPTQQSGLRPGRGWRLRGCWSPRETGWGRGTYLTPPPGSLQALGPEPLPSPVFNGVTHMLGFPTAISPHFLCVSYFCILLLMFLH